jgi:hypothetical protein
MHVAMQYLARFWGKQNRLPTSEQFEALLAHCEEQHTRRQQKAQQHSHVEPRGHAMEAWVQYAMQNKRLPNEAEEDTLMQE